ncbi:histidine--tRNA ligase [Mycoplasma leonicaptivi]|uniref:histidine--tRNA ligase n=1 Tax=Mycoplasma leonicaptivi TaxID=36742 RepID=UPI000483E0D9|nr:histidine--tRNA ligase [Mycoplasma leonicaptivi]
MITKIKGTKDYDVYDYRVKEDIIKAFTYVINKYDYKFIETPIFESCELFKRSVEGSEIVKKEMYEFLDKGDRELALRPEGTASFVRAYIENKWNKTPVKKYAYYGPMFRYEQPQKGRYRQFYQAGIEFVGDKSPLKDFEVIKIAHDVLDILDVDFKLKINTIGDQKSRETYQKVLYEYLLPYKDQLSEISQQRLDSKSVLRILDDKIDSQKDFIKNAPKLMDYLSDESRQYFKKVLSFLDNSDIKYTISDDLVRGLDYYDEVVFEFVESKNKNAQATIIGGGRYSNLIEQLGGEPESSVGFGFGVDRCASIIRDNLIEVSEIQEDLFERYDIYMASSLSEDNIVKLHNLWSENLIMFDGLKVNFQYSIEKSKKSFEKANKCAEFIITDDPKINQNMFVVKHLHSGDKITFVGDEYGVPTLIRFLREYSEIIDEKFSESMFGEYEDD